MIAEARLKAKPHNRRVRPVVRPVVGPVASAFRRKSDYSRAAIALTFFNDPWYRRIAS
jgi:hypothetical protein